MPFVHVFETSVGRTCEPDVVLEAQLETPIWRDESIRSAPQACQASQMAARRVIKVKLGGAFGAMTLRRENVA